MKHLLPAGLLLALCLPAWAQAAAAQSRVGNQTPEHAKPRVVITADPELDDLNSLIRYLLHSADFRTEGLVYASSQFHWKGDGKGTRLSVPGREYTRFGLDLCPCTSWRWANNEHFIDDAVDAYARAFPNLRVHDRAFPSPALLRSKIRWGNVEFDGEMSKDSPGSDLIKQLLLDRDEAPVYLHAWGGQSTIARALKSIEEQFRGTPRWAAVRAKVIRKAVIHPSGDQDDTYRKYIQPNWPEIRYRALEGGMPLSYGAQSRASEEDAIYLGADWTRRNIASRGPLGALYRTWGDGKQMVAGDRFDYFGIAGKTGEQLKAEGYIVWTPVQPAGTFLGEGDTATFLNLLDNGLRGYRDDSFGGWGGLANAAPPRGFSDGGQFESVAGNPDLPRVAPRAPTHPFFAAAQHELAARFEWATQPSYRAANHPPRISAVSARQVAAAPGSTVFLHVRTSDPDRDAVALKWWRWDAADSHVGSVSLVDHGDGRAEVAIPRDIAEGATIHVIAEAADQGSPSLTRYERFVITAIH